MLTYDFMFTYLFEHLFSFELYVCRHLSSDLINSCFFLSFSIYRYIEGASLSTFDLNSFSSRIALYLNCHYMALAIPGWSLNWFLFFLIHCYYLSCIPYWLLNGMFISQVLFFMAFFNWYRCHCFSYRLI